MTPLPADRYRKIDYAVHSNRAIRGACLQITTLSKKGSMCLGLCYLIEARCSHLALEGMYDVGPTDE